MANVKLGAVKNIMLFLFSLFISLGLFSLVFVFVNNEKKVLIDSNTRNINEYYNNVQNNILSEVDSNVVLLDGFISFINVNGFNSNYAFDNYLNSLLKNSDYTINVLRDTTISYSYPNNASSVGLDLGADSEFGSNVLKVKETLKPTFEGPINLFQGGEGFIVRIPIVDDSNAYNGQLSLVIPKDVFLNKIKNSMSSYNVDVAFFKKDNFPDQPFLGKSVNINEQLYTFNLSIYSEDWIIAISPHIDMAANLVALDRLLYISLALALVLFFFIFSVLRTLNLSKTALGIKHFEVISERNKVEKLYKDSLVFNLELESLIDVNRRNFFDIVSALVYALDAKDSYTGGHSQRVMEYSLKVADKLGFSDDDKEDISFGSILHDIGKIGIPETVLNKNSSFTNDEFDTIQNHPQMGYDIVKHLNLSESAKRIILEHHEKVDGSGYPNHLSADAIHPFAKIVCIADAFDAMTSNRSYRKSRFTIKDALVELEKQAGVQFDKEFTDVFNSIIYEEISSGKIKIRKY